MDTITGIMAQKLNASFTEISLRSFKKINEEITFDSHEHDFSPRFAKYFVEGVLGYQGSEYAFERGRTDITLLDENKNRAVVIETKRPNENLDAEKWREQAGKYADASTRFIGLTNGYRILLWEIMAHGRILKVDLDIKAIVEAKRASEEKLTTKETEQVLFLGSIAKQQVWSEAKYAHFDEYYAKIDVSEEAGFEKLIEQLKYISNDLLHRYTYAAFDEYYAGYAQYKQIKDEVEGILTGTSRRKKDELARVDMGAEAKYKQYASFLGYHYWKAVSNRPDDKEEENKHVFCQESVYLLLNRLLFIRICEDKGLLSKKICNGGIERLREQLHEPVLGDTSVFKQIVQFSYGGAKNIYSHFYEKNNPLDWYESGDGELDKVLNKVLWFFNQFNFSKVDRDILGKLYEKYLPKEERKKLGEFYTPDEVVDYILDSVEYVPSKAIENKELIDPACGSGGFLVRAARRLIARQAVKFGKATPKEALDNKKWADVYERLTPKECEEIVTSVGMHIHGFDINPFAVSITEMNLLFQIIDLYTKAAKANNAFKVPRFQIYETDSLEPAQSQSSLPEFYGATGKSLAKDKDASDGLKKKKYDFVVGNPPYVRTHEQEITKRKILAVYSEVIAGQFDLFIPFVKLGYDLLRDKGRISYIVSNKLLANDYAVKLRRFILKNSTIEQILDTSAISWFSASIYPIIFVLKKDNPENSNVALLRIDDAAQLKYGTIPKIAISPVEITSLYNSIIPYIGSRKEFELVKKLSRLPRVLTVYRPKATSAAIIEKNSLEQKAEIFREGYIEVVSNENISPFFVKSSQRVIAKSQKDTPDEPHILMKKLCLRPTAGISNGSVAAVNTTYVVQSKEKAQNEYLAALINSTLLSFYAQVLFFSTHMQSGYIELRTTQIEDFPIKLPSNKKEEALAEKITDKVKEILKLKKKDANAGTARLEAEINSLVFDLYGISPEERKIIQKAIE